MRKTIAFTFFCALWALSSSAQKATAGSNTVESIRKAYQEVHEMMARMMPDKEGMSAMPPEYFDLHVVQNLPATGPHKENIRMYYGELPPKEEGDPYPPHYLRFATSKYNYAAREFYEEYLYDDKGQVMFIYVLTPDVNLSEMVPYELRMWFDGKRLLRFNAKKFDSTLTYIDIKTLKQGSFKDEYMGKTIPEKFSDEVNRCKQSAQSKLKLFKAIENR